MIDNIFGLISVILFCVFCLSSALLRAVLAEVTDEPRNLTGLTQQKYIFWYVKSNQWHGGDNVPHTGFQEPGLLSFSGSSSLNMRVQKSSKKGKEKVKKAHLLLNHSSLKVIYIIIAHILLTRTVTRSHLEARWGGGRKCSSWHDGHFPAAVLYYGRGIQIFGRHLGTSATATLFFFFCLLWDR